MKSRKARRRAQTDCRHAADFIRQDLVWSNDFMHIAPILSDILRSESDQDEPNFMVVALARKLLETEYDLTVDHA